MDLSAFYSQFREETAEHVRALSAGLLALEAEPDPTARRLHLDQIFRAMHTIKGSARMLGFEAVGRLAHALESILGELRQGRRVLDRPLADALLRGGDALLTLSSAAVEGRPATVDVDVERFLAELPVAQAVETSPTLQPSNPPTLPPSNPPTLPPPASQPPASPQQTVRVRVDRLDRLLNLAGELVIGQQVFANQVEQIDQLQELAAHQRRALAALEVELARLRFSATQRQAIEARLLALRTALDATQTLAQNQGGRFARHANQHELLVKDLEQEVMAARLLPIATVYARLPRVVRDLAQSTAKQVRLELHGEAVELDRKVLELINDPLLHLVRNAVDHGIEAPDERAAAGKPPVGLIAVHAEALGGEVRLTISDDGRGLVPQQLRERAIRLGLLAAAQATLLSDAEARELIFQPGFSTASTVSEISGRGVGLDVVRSNLGELGGHAQVESQPGQGARLVLTLPLTLVTTRVLLARVGGATFALPVNACHGTCWVYATQLRSLEGQPTMEHEGRTVAVVALAELLGLAGSAPLSRAERAPALLVGNAQRPVALLVDALLDEREAVIKPLGALLASQRRYGGAVQLGDGSLVLLLNPLLLVQGARAARPLTGTPRAPARRRLLVADDSFITRELIRSILQGAGYEVAAAVDGADALDKLRSQPYDLVVSDVEMPRLDGFQLTARLRAQPATEDVPVVLITSLASDEHRRRGLEAGAQAYIVKNQFNQNSLLDVIRQLLDYEG